MHFFFLPVIYHPVHTCPSNTQTQERDGCFLTKGTFGLEVNICVCLFLKLLSLLQLTKVRKDQMLPQCWDDEHLWSLQQRRPCLPELACVSFEMTPKHCCGDAVFAVQTQRHYPTDWPREEGQSYEASKPGITALWRTALLSCCLNWVYWWTGMEPCCR